MMDPADAPEIIALWDRTHTARKPRQCASCGETIQAGEKYQSTGYRIDGAFEHWVRHYGGEQYPSGCPKQGAIDRAEAEEQFRKDEALWNQTPNPYPSTPQDQKGRA